MGYEHSFMHPVADFLDSLAKGQPAQPDFRNRVRYAACAGCDSGFGEGGRWVEVGKG
jgi:hypothetical protein